MPHSIGRTELAIRYNPHITPDRAWKKLKDWINAAGDLPEQLARTGYSESQRSFTPKQVDLIIQYLGDP